MQANKKETSQLNFENIKDVIAPPALKIESRYLQLGEKYLRTFFIFSYPRFLTTGWLSPVINFDRTFNVSIFVHPIETALILKKLRNKVAEVETQIISRQEKGMVRDPALETAYKDLEALRDKLMQAQEKLFKVGVYITIIEDSLKNLDKVESEFKSLLESRLIFIKETIFQQEYGFNSTIPLALDQIEIHTSMNTSPLSSAFPFISADLTSDKGILYGINRHNNSLIIFDRFSMENANMVIFAKSGSGKSYTAKLEVLRSMMFGTDVIIIDPENEYQYLAETVNGAFFKISLNSPHHINPFDLPKPTKNEKPADVLRENIINLTGLLKLMLGGVTADEAAVLDRTLYETYASKDITPETKDWSNLEMPLLTDFQTILENMEGGENLAKKLEKFTTGTFAGFLNQPSNVNINNQLVVFSIRDMQEELRPIAMYLIMTYIWSAIRKKLKKRLLLIDEAWVLMQFEEAAAFVFGISKRCRKYYLGLTTITQDINDFIKSKYGQPIITNSSIQLLLKQSPATIDAVKKTFNLTDQETYLLLECNVGEGIFFAGLKRAAIKIIASYTEDQIITSNPAQLLEIEKAKAELEEEG